uniref:hypothetical protein n=1 Tax=Salmonella sp. s55004 TaxID=3159675 RepID=UPI00397F74D9
NKTGNTGSNARDTTRNKNITYASVVIAAKSIVMNGEKTLDMVQQVWKFPMPLIVPTEQDIIKIFNIQKGDMSHCTNARNHTSSEDGHDSEKTRDKEAFGIRKGGVGKLRNK